MNSTQYYNNYYDGRRINLSLTYKWGTSKTNKLKSIDFNEKTELIKQYINYKNLNFTYLYVIATTLSDS